jgi:hypothetical protein
VEDIPLGEFLKLVSALNGLKLDEATGEIYRED